MCLLTYFPPMAAVDTERLSCGADCNPHGHGYAIVTADGQVLINHNMRPTRLIAEFAELRERYPDSHALFHSRITTHGSTSLENCHPFIVTGPRGGQTILAHNGILPADCQPRKGDNRSDTRILAEDMLWKRWNRFPIPRAYTRRGRERSFTHQWLDSPLVRADIEKWLGRGSKVLVLTTSPRLNQTAYLLNEGLGEWVDGVWYSNGSYERWTSPYTGTSYTWRNSAFVPTSSRKGSTKLVDRTWWEDTTPTATASTIAGPIRQGELWEGRRWYPTQSYLHHFHGRACDICDSRVINRQDYVCDTCGVCWICNNYFTDCDRNDQGLPCGRTLEVRELFDKAIGYVWVPTSAQPYALTAGSSKGAQLQQIIDSLGESTQEVGTVVKSAAESAAVFREALNADNA